MPVQGVWGGGVGGMRFHLDGSNFIGAVAQPPAIGLGFVWRSGSQLGICCRPRAGMADGKPVRTGLQPCPRVAMGASGPKPGPLFAPLILRVVLGVTFIWAGLGKLVPLVEFNGQDAAILANLGTGIVPSKTTKAPLATDAPALAPPATLPLPDPPVKPAPNTPAKPKPSSRQQRSSPDIGYTTQGTVLASLDTGGLPAAADTARSTTKKPSTNVQTPSQPPIQPPPVQPPATGKPVNGPATDTLPPGGKFRATDFTEPARARRAYGLSVLMVRAAYPQPSIGVQRPKAYWPAIFATSPWVVWLAFGAAVVELFAGVLVLVGFLTRLSSLMLVLVMATALWLTQIGPALSIGQTQFGFLPDKTWWDPQLWSTFFWQLLIIATGIAVACMGSGALSVDRALAVIGSGGPKTEQDPSAKG